mgnify:FL=1
MLIVYLLLVCVLIGARTASKMVAKIDKNPAMVQVAKPILQFDLADAKTTKEILPNESINYKILVKNFTSASNISETKLKYKFNINKRVTPKFLNFDYQLFEVNGITETEVNPSTYIGTLNGNSADSKVFLLKVTWIDNRVDYNVIKDIVNLLDVSVEAVQDIT